MLLQVDAGGERPPVAGEDNRPDVVAFLELVGERVGVTDGDHMNAATESIRKGGTVVMTGLGYGPEGKGAAINNTMLTVYQKRIQGALYGGFVVANVLKWYWWRFNGYGYFWGMLAGIGGACVASLVAEREGQVLGYAYANYFRPRMAYRFALEDSIYLAPSAQGQGVGTLLLDELIRQCQALGARQMLAVIGDSANQGSIRLHAKAGFEATGVMRSVGWKFERWLDVVIMQKTLGEGDSTVPVDPPLAG